MREEKRLSVPWEAINLKKWERSLNVSHLNHWCTRNPGTGNKCKQTLGISLVLERIQPINHNLCQILQYREFNMLNLL